MYIQSLCSFQSRSLPLEELHCLKICQQVRIRGDVGKDLNNLDARAFLVVVSRYQTVSG